VVPAAELQPAVARATAAAMAMKGVLRIMVGLQS
jgi:hypothetical protein